jgi:hypothetical protein
MIICCGDDGTPVGWPRLFPGLEASECTSQLVLFLYRFCIESDKDQIRRVNPREFQPQSVYSANKYPVNFWLLSQPVIHRNNQSWHASYKLNTRLRTGWCHIDTRCCNTIGNRALDFNILIKELCELLPYTTVPRLSLSLFNSVCNCTNAHMYVKFTVEQTIKAQRWENRYSSTLF